MPLLEETKIVSPDIIVFTVGPHHEFPERICRLLETPLAKPCHNKPLVILPTEKLNALVCLTYHPNYLNRSKLMSSVIAEIEELMNKRINHLISTNQLELLDSCHYELNDKLIRILTDLGFEHICTDNNRDGNLHWKDTTTSYRLQISSYNSDTLYLSLHSRNNGGEWLAHSSINGTPNEILEWLQCLDYGRKHPTESAE